MRRCLAIVFGLLAVAGACTSAEPETGTDDTSADAGDPNGTSGSETSEPSDGASSTPSPDTGSSKQPDDADASPIGQDRGWIGPQVADPSRCTTTIADGDELADLTAGATVCLASSDRRGETIVIDQPNVTLLADGEVTLGGVEIEADGVRVEGFTITTAHRGEEIDGIYISGNGVVIHNNHIVDIDSSGISCENDIDASCSGVVVTRNTVERAVGVVVEVWGSDVLVADNIIRDPVYTPDGRDTDALRVMAGTGQTIRNNLLVVPNINEISEDPHPDCIMMFDDNNEQFAAWVDNVDVLIESNVCVNDADHNCFIFLARHQGRSHNFVVRNNICDHAGHDAFFFEGIDDVIVVNNLCTARLQRACVVIEGDAENIVVANNLSYGPDTMLRDAPSNDQPVVALSNVQTESDGDTASADDAGGADSHERYRPTLVDSLIDAGDPQVDAGSTDITGSPRVQGTGVDIGPYELG